MNEDNDKIETSPRSYLFLIITILCILFIAMFYLFRTPSRLNDVTIHISQNDSLSKISNDLKDKHVIKNSFAFKLLITIFSGDKHISKGDYMFKKNESFVGVIWQLSRSKHKVTPVRITIKEGMTNANIAELLAIKIPSFKKDLFLSDSRSRQGYLFPDTYFFFPLSTTDEIITEITNNFNKKISTLDKDIKSSKHSLSDIIVMASILEKEADGESDIYIISDILWKRIKLGMPLQVDAAPDTYENIGLPSNPISNPGLLSIKAAIYPKESNYLFYLHDDSGQVHYAKDFSEHRSNIAHYLK